MDSAKLNIIDYSVFLDEFGSDAGASSLEKFRERLSPELEPIAHYFLFWGIEDDVERAMRMKKAPDRLLANFSEIFTQYQKLIDDWMIEQEQSKQTVDEIYMAVSSAYMVYDLT